MSYRAAVLADNPLHFWDLQQTAGTTATDFGTTARNGTFTGSWSLNQPGPQAVSQSDKAVTGNGSNTYVTIAHASDLDITGDLTLSMWVKPASFNNVRFLVTKVVGDGGSTSAYEWRLQQNTGKQWYSHGPTTSLDSTTALTVGLWSHIAVTRTGASIAFYLNGQPDGGGTTNASFPPTANSSAVDIGTRADRFSYANWTGAYVALWNRALSAAELQAHYVATTPGPVLLYQAPVEVAYQAAEAVRLQQYVLEVATSGGEAVRVLQLPAEVAYQGAAQLQAAQLVAETVAGGDPQLQLDQALVEAVVRSDEHSALQLAQVAVEAVVRSDEYSALQATQVVVEVVLQGNPAYTPPPPVAYKLPPKID